MTLIHTETYGQGQSLVMIHGWAMHSGVWREFAQLLAQQYQVICVDLPGHGLSAPVKPYSLQNMAEAILQVLPAGPSVLLGWSLGATVAMAMAERAPERVQQLLIVAGNPKFVETADWPGVKAETLDAFGELLKTDVQQTLARFLALQVNGLAHGKSLLQRLKKALQECPPPDVDVLQAGLEILKHSDLRAFVVGRHVPVRFILAEKDTLVPVQCGERIRRLNPGIDVQVLESAGHAPFLSHPQQLLAAIGKLP